MTGFTITATNKRRIAEAVKEFMEKNDIQGEVRLVFTAKYTPKGGDTIDCCSKTIHGRYLAQCPCNG